MNFNTRRMKTIYTQRVNKVLGILILAISLSLSLSAQQRFQGSLYHLNGYSLNTAYAGLNQCTEGFLGHKNQWVGVDGAPVNTYLQVHTGLGENFGIGGGIYRWRNGLLTNYDFSLALAHHLNLNRELKFSYSVNFGYFLTQFESGDVVAFDDDLHTGQQQINDGGFYADLGLLLSHEKFEFGIALPRLFNSNLDFSGNNTTAAFETERYLNIHGKYKYELNENIMLIPALTYRGIPSHNGIFDIMVGAEYKKMIGLNLGYRTRNGLFASAHYTHNDFITVGYAYDAGMSNLNGISGGSHEIMLGIKFCKKKKEKAEKEPEPTPEPEKEFFANGKMTDSKTGEPLVNQTLTIKNDSTGETSTLTTDSAGNFSSRIYPDQAYTVSATDPNYKDHRSSFATADLQENKDLSVGLEPKQASYFGVVTDANTKEPLEGVTVSLNNEGENYSAVTDGEGKFSMDLTDKRLNDPLNYEVTFSKQGYAKVKRAINSALASFEPMDLMEQLDAEVTMQSFDHGADIAEIIDLKPIYFELSKFDITPDAAEELDKVVEVMTENPEMQILIGAHTDCRGSEALNAKLSDKRAKASAEYVKGKITNPERISGKGFGESQPLTDCKCSNCSEEEHAKNRRTTFEIVGTK